MRPPAERMCIAQMIMGVHWLHDLTSTIIRGVLRDKLHRKQREVVHRKKRRGGWHPKPRQFELYHTSLNASPARKWEHDSTRSTLWLYLNAPDAPHWDDAFRQEFGVPRCIFNDFLQTLQGVEGFKDKTRGDGRRGRRSKPLQLKLALWFLTHREGFSFKRAGRIGCMDPGMFRKFFHKLNAWLVEHEYAKHVFMP